MKRERKKKPKARLEEWPVIVPRGGKKKKASSKKKKGDVGNHGKKKKKKKIAFRVNGKEKKEPIHLREGG